MLAVTTSENSLTGATNGRHGDIPVCRGHRCIFNLATCYAGLNGRVRPVAAPHVTVVFDSTLHFFKKFLLASFLNNLLYVDQYAKTHLFRVFTNSIKLVSRTNSE